MNMQPSPKEFVPGWRPKRLAKAPTKTEFKRRARELQAEAKAARKLAAAENAKAIAARRLAARRKLFAALEIELAETAALTLRKAPLISDIIKIVAAHYETTPAEIISARRPARIIRPRHITAYLARTMTARSLPDIGRRLYRDHSTIIYAVGKISLEMERDPALAAEIEELKILIDPSLAPGDLNQMALPFEVAAE